MYKKIIKNSQVIGILKDTYISIPLDLANFDYQEYLKWIDLGNIPEEEER